MTSPVSSWVVAGRADARGARLADRHYSRKTIGAKQFTPPGRIVCLISPSADAVWATIWAKAEFVDHAWPGAWVNTIFRNESDRLSSELIREAVSVTRFCWPDVPEHGLITFIDPKKLNSENPGYCYLMAGFHRLKQRTKGGLRVMQMLAEDMPDPIQPGGTTIGMVLAS